MSGANMRVIAKITFWLNMFMAALAVSSSLIGWLSQSFILFPPLVSTVAYAGLVIYWRFWYVFALPAFYLGQNTYASRRRLLLTALSVVVILMIKFLYGYQLPD